MSSLRLIRRWKNFRLCSKVAPQMISVTVSISIKTSDRSAITRCHSSKHNLLERSGSAQHASLDNRVNWPRSNNSTSSQTTARCCTLWTLHSRHSSRKTSSITCWHPQDNPNEHRTLWRLRHHLLRKSRRSSRKRSKTVKRLTKNVRIHKDRAECLRLNLSTSSRREWSSRKARWRWRRLLSTISTVSR